ncbi:hypothetical protein TSUD_408350 [Trifolium subterraneum]|uniref:Retrotransposon gag domain-containing protein n=1 Tax=Trifolium subterraneum TaxID=3900 RepID=A0A2Z6P0F2_TRISU|nr:hypothetical protein TSUD_408350 [Trifolium subterraneum]
MERIPNNDGGPGMNLQAAVGEINRLKAKMTAMEQEKAAEKEKEKEEEAELDNIQDSQPLAQALWDAQVPANFKIPQLPTFEGKTDPLEHLMAVGTQTAIIGAEEDLKCKLLSSTLKDAALRWYMNLPKNSIASYTDFHKKFIHQFVGSKHVQVTATNLFGIRQGHNENLREYLARFNEATIQVSNPNQEMFVAAVQNECYIKGEESNAEKRSRDLREKPSSRRSPERYHRRSSQRSGRYEDTGSGRYHQPWQSNERTYRVQEESPLRADDEKEPRRIAVNTIVGGFAGGGESRAARKRYLRRIIQETNMVAHVSSPKAPEISFSPSDGEGMFPHDDDPLVIQVQILNCDVKRLLIDFGSSTNIMYWEAFKAMQLAGEQLQPYNGTLVGFGGEQVGVMGHVTLLTTFGEKENAKTIKAETNMVETSDLDPREEFQDIRVSPIEDLEYGADAVIPAEVDPPSWRRATLTAEVNSEALKENLDLLEEVREAAHFREFMVKQRASRKYNTRVMAREFREGDLVLKRAMGRNKGGKLALTGKALIGFKKHSEEVLIGWRH